MVKLENRLIAFFDILGFSSQLASRPLEELHAQYAALIDDVQNTVFSPQNLATVAPHERKQNFDRARFVSDSIVLVSREVDLTGSTAPAVDFMFAAITLMEKSFAAELPIRGAIGFGDCLEDTARDMLLSATLASVVQAEKVQQWSGCVVLPSAERVLVPLVPASAADRGAPLIRFPVPWKSSEGELPAENWCLNWVHFLSPRELWTGMAYLRGPKKGSTQRFVEHVLALPTEQYVALPPTAQPAEWLLTSLCSGGLRIKFANGNGEGVDPERVTMQFHVKRPHPPVSESQDPHA